jgi:hypothetical protein
MPDDAGRAERVRSREAARLRLRRLTVASAAGAAALSALFGGLVARGVPGRRTVSAPPRTPARQAPAPMPEPVPVASSAPAPPQQPPTAAAGAPVVVSGGS